MSFITFDGVRCIALLLYFIVLANMKIACVQTITKLLLLVPYVKQHGDPGSGQVLDPQRTQQITRSAFRISLQPDW